MVSYIQAICKIHTQKCVSLFRFFSDVKIITFPQNYLSYLLFFSCQITSNSLQPDELQHAILCHLLLLPSIFPSIRVFSNESALRIRRPKFWNFSFSISPSSEYSGLIWFRIDWLDLLAAQETLKTLEQCYETDAEMDALTSKCQDQASNLGLWDSEPPMQQMTGCLQGPQSPH